MSEQAGVRYIEVPGWPKPKGYQNGALVTGMRTLYVAGQVGWNERQEMATGFVAQFAQALDNVLAVVRAAGGTPESVVKMTIYVTDLPAYRDAQRELGAVWRTRFGKHFPAMALLGIAGLVEDGALLEIESICALAEQGGVG
jgi:enamine deaminase RidA (YjgF/YER057c/UK114 family)